MISPDLPITKSSEDRLSRESFAASLADVMLQTTFPTSFTVGLYGAWGSGKTSLLNMIIEQVERRNADIVILRFNPWLCSDPKQLITQFFKQLAGAIKIKRSKRDTVYRLFDEYADLLDAVNLIPHAGPAIAAIGKALITKARNYMQQENNDMQQQKDKIIRAMTKSNMKIIISIDDIDRLSEEEIIAVFQLVKALGDFPNAVYLLAFDYDVVVRALTEVQHGSGREYLEKVIQVPFEIPTPNMNSIHEALFSKLNVILKNIPESRWSKAAWAELFQYGIRNYIKSIRDVIRYSNVFYLKYQLLQNETDPIDLLGLTCIQVFEPIIYSTLVNYKHELCGSINDYSYERQRTDEQKIKKAVSDIFADGAAANEEEAKRILGFLFPKAKAALECGYSFGRSYDHRRFLINRNIAVSECFDRYFSLSLENEAIPTATINNLIYKANENELIAKIDWLYKEGKIIRLLESIEAYANKGDLKNIPAERAAILIRCLCQMWSSFEVEEEGLITIPFAWRLLFCINPLLGTINTVDRISFLQNIFEDKMVKPSVLALLLQDFERQHGRCTDKGLSEDKKLISLEELLMLESLFKSRCIEAIDSGAALSQYKGLSFLWMLSQVDEKLAKRIKETLVTDDISLVKVISCCTFHGRMVVGIVVKTRQVDKKSLNEFIDVEEAYQRIDAFVTTRGFLQLPIEEQKDVIAFIMTMKKDENNSQIDGPIAEDIIKEKLEKITKAIYVKA